MTVGVVRRRGWAFEGVAAAVGGGAEVCVARWYRRLSKDYEFVLESSVSWIYLAMVHIVVRWLEGSKTKTSVQLQGML